MQKIIRYFKHTFICILLSFSLVCTNTAGTTYQAAAIPVAISAWEVLVTIFALLGISLCAAPELDEQATQELLDAYNGWKVLKSEGNGDNNNDDDFLPFDPLSCLFGNKVTVPEEELELLQEFVHEQGWTSQYRPSDTSTNLYGASVSDVISWLLTALDIDSAYASNTYVNSFVNRWYDIFTENDFSCLITIDHFSDNDAAAFYTITSDTFYGFREDSSSNPDNVLFYSNNSYIYKSDAPYTYQLCYVNGIPTEFIKNSMYSNKIYYGEEAFLIVHGYLYDLYSICSFPENLTSSADFGSRFQVSDLLVPSNHFGDALTDAANKIGDMDLSGLIEAGNLDVIGGGREFDKDKQEATGDITVTVPGSDIIDAYENGLISYEDFLDKLGVTPIDEAAGTNLLTQELLDTEKGIFNGVNSILDILKNIWDFLSNMISNLVDALIDMLLYVFVPPEGYFTEYFNRVLSLFEGAFGFLYTPVDMLLSLFDIMTTAEFGSTQLYFPGIKFQEYVLCEPMYVELNLRDEFPGVYKYMYFITNSIMIGAVLWLLQSKAKELIKN